MSQQYATYVLRDPETRSIRYIGKSKQRLSERLSRHVRDALEMKGGGWADKTHRANWIRKLHGAGATPEMVEICRYDSLEQVNEAEKFLIKHFRAVRDDLTNATAGGDGGITPRKPAVDDSTVLEAYRNGMRTAQIAAKFHTCKKRIQRVIKAAGLTTRKRSR